MKKGIKSVILFLVLLILQEPVLIGQHVRFASDLMVRGKVKRMTEKRFTAKTEMDEVEMDELEHKAIYQFYEGGNIKSISYSENSNGDVRYLYRQDGRLLSKTHKNDNEYRVDSVVYNETGMVLTLMNTKKTLYNGQVSKTHYDYNRNQNGDIVSITRAKGDSYYNYDERPCFNCREVYKDHIGSIMGFYRINEELIEKNWSYSSGLKATAEYQYDAQGNWTKCTYFANEDSSNLNEMKPTMIITREFSYYSGQ
jgi:hypothetical protein